MSLSLVSQTVVASGNSGAISDRQFGQANTAVFELAVTGPGTAVGDTLDVYVQSSPDGAVWDDFVHFTQVLGNGGSKTFLAEWTRAVSAATAQAAPVDGGLAVGVKQGPVSSVWRVKWIVVSSSAPSFPIVLSVDTNREA